MAGNNALQCRFAEFELDEARRLLLRRGRPVRLGQKALSLLIHLIRNRHRVVGTSELRETLWQGKTLAPSTIPTAITTVRRALDDSSSDPSLVGSVYGHGYRWLSPVHESIPTDIDPASASAARGFVGRSRELRALRATLGLDTEEFSSVFVIGDPGIGKTRLLEEFAFQARRRGSRVGLGTCSAADEAPALLPWLQVLDSLGYKTGIDRSSFHPQSDLTDEIGVVVETLRVAALADPLVVVVDDLHEADSPSLAALGMIAGVLRPAGLRLVASYRPRELTDLPPDLVERVSRIRPSRTIRLAGLEQGAVKDLICQYDNWKTDDSVVESMVQRTAGNPLFLERELLKEFGADAAMTQFVDVRFREVFESHLRRLSDATRHALSCAAAVGNSFDLGVLRRVVGTSESATLRMVEEGLAEGLLKRHGTDLRFSFVQSQIRDQIYSEMTPIDRSAVHRRVVSALEDVHGILAGDAACEAARHAVAATDVQDIEYCMSVLEQAVVWSRENGGPHRTIVLLEDCLHLLGRSENPHPSVRIDLLVRLGEALQQGGESSRAAKAFGLAAEAARLSGDPELVVQAVLGATPGLSRLGLQPVSPTLLRLIPEACAKAGTSQSKPRARLMSHRILALGGAEDREHRDPGLTGMMQSPLVLAAAETVAGDTRPKAIDVLRAGTAEAERIGDGVLELVFSLNLIGELLRRGDDAECLTLSRRLSVLPQPYAGWFSEIFRANRALLQGDWQAVSDSCERLNEASRPSNPAIQSAVSSLAVHCKAECVGWAEAYRVELEAENTELNRSRLTFLTAAGGRRSDAMRLFARCVDHERIRMPRTDQWLYDCSMLAEAAVRLNDAKRGRILFDELIESSDSFAVAGLVTLVWRPVSYLLARLASLLGENREAERFFEKAVDAAALSEPATCEIKLAFAQFLRRRAWPGDGKRARELALGTEEAARDLAMAPLHEAARFFLWGHQRPASGAIAR